MMISDRRNGFHNRAGMANRNRVKRPHVVQECETDNASQQKDSSIMIDNPLIEEFLDHLRHKRHCSPYTAKCYATDLLQFQGYLLEEADDRSETSTTAGVSDLNSSEGGTGLAVLTSRSVVTLAARCASPVSLVETTTEDVQRFLASLRRRGCTAGTVARKLATLRSLFRFGLKRCYNRSDPSA